VFATTVTRDAAFGGANKVLAEGQLAYIEASNIVQYYDGAAWATVGPAAAGALVRVGGGTLSGTTTIINNIFSATYNAYKIVITGIIGSVDEDWIVVKMVDSGGTVISTNYSGARWTLNDAGSTSAYGTPSGSWPQTGHVRSEGKTSMVTYEFGNPFLATWTSMFSLFSSQSTTGYSGGQHQLTTSYTGLQFSLANSFSAGLVNVYGYSLS